MQIVNKKVYANVDLLTFGKAYLIQFCRQVCIPSSVTFEIDAMNQNGHFSIPTDICKLLGLNHDDDIHLIISNPNGEHLFSGPWQLKSGYEIYGQEMEKE